MPAPVLGDRSVEFKATDPSDGSGPPTVTYTIDVLYGAVVLTTQETGVADSLTSSAEVEKGSCYGGLFPRRSIIRRGRQIRPKPNRGLLEIRGDGRSFVLPGKCSLCGSR